MHRLAKAATLLSLTLLAALGGCGKKTEPPAEMGGDYVVLRYVDADTPYLFAALEPAPDDVYEKIEPRLDKLLDAYRDLISVTLREGLEQDRLEQAADEAAGDSASGGPDIDEESAERIIAVVDHLLGMFSAEGMKEAGLSRDSEVALYGAGLLPVLRITLADVAAFEKTLAELETEAGTEMQSATLDRVTYRYVGDDEARVVIAIVDEQMVASLVPASLSEDGLRTVLGLTKPTRSIAESGALADIAGKYGYTANGAGFVDIERLAGTFLDAPSGINAEVLALADYDAAALSDVCREEMRGLAAIAPRLVTGYTEYNAERMTSNTVLELRSDIAAGLSKLTAAVPGLGNDHGGLVSFGMSIDLLAAREFYEARLDAMDENPFRCELLGGMQAGVAQGRAALEQPVPPIVYGFKGFLAIVDGVEGLDLARKQPPTSIDLRLLLASDNAPGLLAMGTMFSPELAALNLQADGKPVRFESPQLQPPIEAAWLALSDGAIALAVGQRGEQQVGGMLSAKAGEPPPLFSMHMDAARYYSFIGDAVTAQQDEPASAEQGRAVKNLMQSLSELIDRVSISVMFTERGIEIPAVTTLAD